MHRSRKIGGWILFIAIFLVLSLGATPYHKFADTALIAVRLSLLLILSILVIWERWNHRRDLPGGRGIGFSTSLRRSEGAAIRSRQRDLMLFCNLCDHIIS